jgi:hypothetical protein
MEINVGGTDNYTFYSTLISFHHSYPGPGAVGGGEGLEFAKLLTNVFSGNTKGGSITVPLPSCLTGLD